MDLYSGIIFAFVSMFAFGLSTVAARDPIKRVGPYNTIIYRGIITSLSALVIFIFIPFSYALNPFYIMIAAGIGLLGFIPYYTFLKAIDISKIGLISPITGSSFLVTVMLSVLFYGETLGPLRILSVFIILLGVVLLTIDTSVLKKDGLRLLPGIGLAFITFFLWGLFFFLNKIPVMVIGPFLFLLISEIFVFLPAVFINMKKGRLIRPDKTTSVKLFLCGLFIAVAGSAFNIGITLTDMSIVTPITKASPIIAVIGARIFYGEKMKSYQYAAVLIVITGIIGLSLF